MEQEYFFYINPSSGEMNLIDDLNSDFEDKNQVLKIIGRDFGPHYEGSIQSKNGSWVDLTYEDYSKFLSIEGSESLNIKVGNYFVNSISRVLPKFEYEFVVTDIISKEQNNIKFDNYHSGFKSLIENSRH